MVLFRRLLGDVLRAHRMEQGRTLRQLCADARVSLGYMSEIERGQKEASSELLAAICDALGARFSELLSEVSDTLSLAEDMDGVLLPVDDKGDAVKKMATDGNVSVSVRQESPLKATLHATRKPQRDVVYAA